MTFWPSQRLLWLCWLAFVCIPSLAQQFRFRVLGQDDGLLNLNVRSMVQDRIGYLWLGTDNGVFRYDGAGFTRFSTKEGLPAAYVVALALAPDGAIWVSTHGGVAYYENGRFVTVPLPESFGINAMAISASGSVVVSAEQGVFVLSRARTGDAWTHRRISTLHAGVLLAAADGSYWFNCGSGLCRVDSAGATKEFVAADGVPAAEWRGLIQDKLGQIFARSSSSLVRLTAPDDRFQAIGPPHIGGTGLLYAGASGTLLTDTADGLAIFNGTTWRSITRGNGLPAGDLISLLEDSDGSLWVGIDSLGLARWAGRDIWENWNIRDGLTDDEVTAVTVDSRNRTWIGTASDLSILESKSRSLQTVSRGRSVALASHGNNVWSADSAGTVTRWDAASGHSFVYGPRHGLPRVTVRGLLEDAQGRLWVTALQGIYVGRPANGQLAFSRFDPPDAQPGDMHLEAAESSSGAIYIASTRGLLFWAGGHWHRFDAKQGLRHSRLRHVTALPDGSLLVSYSDALGVSRFRIRQDGTFRESRHYDTAQGMSSDRIYSMAADSKRRIWIGTDRGVDILENERWIHHDTNSGLIWNDTVHSAIAVDGGDGVWIGTRRGLAHFLTGALTVSHAPPRVAISSWSLGDRQSLISFGPGFAPPVPSISGAPGLQVTLAGMSYLNNSGTLYRYRLYGVDDHWIESSQSTVRYPALRAGHYRFQAYGKNGSGAISAKPVELAFTVQAPWWHSRWVIAGALVFLALLARFAWRIRLRLLLARQRLLEEAVHSRTHTVEQQKAEIEQLLIEARQASHAKSAFLANMSHEIRTPLNGVVGMADLLLLADTLESEQQSQALILRKSALDLLHLLNDMLDMAKIEAGKLNLEIAPFVLGECVGGVANLLSGLAVEKGLKLQVDSNTSSTVVLGDAHRLRQVLTNLTSNAIKFSMQGTVIIRVLTVPCKADRACVAFEVIDQGIGIPPDRLHSIFDPFEQAESSTSRRFGGTGLGLAICQELVGKMGGTIHVESTVGKGSRFYFALEMEQLPKLPAAPVAPPPAVASTPLRILLCEDNPVNQRIASRMLETLGHSVTIAADGRAAIETFQKAPFDVVFMDLMMPEVDGIEATRRIRELENAAGSRIPIIALTASAFREDIDRCLQAGMDGFVSKPFIRQSLADEVARVRAIPV